MEPEVTIKNVIISVQVKTLRALRPCLKEYPDGAQIMLSGKLFQILTLLTKKEDW